MDELRERLHQALFGAGRFHLSEDERQILNAAVTELAAVRAVTWAEAKKKAAGIIRQMEGNYSHDIAEAIENMEPDE